MSSQQNFNPDRPIESSEQDKLGRAGFAKQLAERISDWRGQESLVIGLYGDWGSGKSSVKNLILERLRMRGEVAPIVVEFNPWLVSGEEKITQSFFAEIGSKLESGDATANARAASWKNYARALGFTSRIAGAFDLVSPFFGIVPPKIGAWVAKRLKKAQELAESAANSLEHGPVSLDEAKRKLRDDFRELKKPLLIVVDDIDRLTTEEICLIFRLVKANADFPNFVYMLLFQRETVERALNKISNDKGAEFLEKIVQVGFDLPAPLVKELHQLMFERINEMLGSVAWEDERERERWANLWTSGLSRHFTNLRDVYRFLNSFGFMVSTFGQKGTFEVNVVDLIALECIRIFEPSFYTGIKENKAMLTQRQQRRTMGEDRLQVLLTKLEEVARNDGGNLKHLLELLFPQLGSNYSDEYSLIWTRQKRICVPEFFDRYFALQLAPGQISESTVQRILTAGEDRGTLQRIFSELEREGLLLSILERLEAEDSLDKLPNPLPYLLTLVDHSDYVPKTLMAGFPFPGNMLVRNAVNRVLGHLDNGDAKTKLLTALIRDSQAIGLTAEWIEDIGEPKESNGYAHIEQKQFVELKELWLERVRAAAKDGRLLGLLDTPSVFFRWVKWGQSSEVTNWVASILEDPKRTLALLKQQINSTSSITLGSNFVREKNWLPWKRLESLQSHDAWKQVAPKLAHVPSISDDEKDTLKLFRAAMERWGSGVGDEDRRSFETHEQSKRIASMKQGLKGKEEPVELSQSVQKEFFSRSVNPLLVRLIESTAQFDELFALSLLGFFGTYSVAGAPGGSANWNLQLPGAEKRTAPEKLEAELSKGRLFSALQISFLWQGFQKADFNAFQESILLEFKFEKFYYELKVNHGGREQPELKGVYQNLISDDVASKIVTDCTEACLKSIERQTRQK